MEKALVLGASGGMGYALVKELIKAGVSTVAFARNKSKLERLFHSDLTEGQLEVKVGDAFNPDDLARACEGVEYIFYALNIPYYEWEERYPVLLRNVLTAAKRSNSKVIIVDNIYAYGASPGHPVSEDTPKQPHTKKGRIRLKLENMALEAHQQGTPVLIAHFPDFYGPNAESTLLNYTLRAVHAGKKGDYIGKQDIPREFIFTLDGARTLIQLAKLDQAYGQNWNIPGVGLVTGDEIQTILKELTGYDKKLRTITKPMIAFLGLFNPMMREMVEMMYLNAEPVILDGSKLQGVLESIPQTSYKEGIRQTLEFMSSSLKP